MKNTKIKIFKILLGVVVLTLCIGIIIYLFPVMKDLSTTEGQVAFKEKVQNTGIAGMFSLLGLQVAQIFLFIIPGEPIEILAGMCYGALWGTVFIMLSSCAVSIMIFLLVRKLGRKFIYNFCDEEKIKKIENNKWFQNPKKIELIILISFLIPGMPKDLLVYIAALLPIRPVRFIAISTIARFPSVITSTLAGTNLAVGDWKRGIILYLLILLLVAVILGFMYVFDKSNTTKDFLKSINEKNK